MNVRLLPASILCFIGMVLDAQPQPVKTIRYNWPGGQSRAVFMLKKDVLHGKQQYRDQTGNLLYDLQMTDGLLDGQQRIRIAGGDWRTENWQKGSFTSYYKFEVEDGGRVVAELVWGCKIVLLDSQLTGKRYLKALKTYYGDTQRRSVTIFTDTGQYSLWSPAGIPAASGAGTAAQPSGFWTYRYQESVPGSEGKTWARGRYPYAETLNGPECTWSEPGPEDIIYWLENYISKDESVEFDPDHRMETGNWWYFDTSGRLTERHLNDTVSLYYYQENNIVVHRFGDSAWGRHIRPDGSLAATFHSFSMASDSVSWYWYDPAERLTSEGLTHQESKQGPWRYYDSLHRLKELIVFDRDTARSARVLSYVPGSGDILLMALLRRYDHSEITGPDETPRMRRDSAWIWYHPGGRLKRVETYVKGRYDELPHLDSVQEWDTLGRPTASGNASLQVRLRYNDQNLVIAADTYVLAADAYWSPAEPARADMISGKVDSGRLKARTVLYADGALRMKLNYGVTDCQPRILHGKQQGWHPNGQTWFELTTICGKPYGTATEWYNEGGPSIQWKYCDSTCAEEIYYTRTGKAMRYTGGFTETSIQRYNQTANREDLVPVPRPAQIQAILDASFLKRFIRP